MPMPLIPNTFIWISDKDSRPTGAAFLFTLLARERPKAPLVRGGFGACGIIGS